MEIQPSRVQPGSVQRRKESNNQKPAEEYPVPDSTTESGGDEAEGVEGVAEFGRYAVEPMSPALDEGSSVQMREPSIGIPATTSFVIAPRAERVSKMRGIVNKPTAWSGKIALKSIPFIK